MRVRHITSTQPIGVLVADSNHLQSQLLVGALRRRQEFTVNSCAMEIETILRAVAGSPVQVALLNAGHNKQNGQEMSVVRRLHFAHPEIAEILLLEISDRESVVNAFRSGARGLFSSSNFGLLCKCIESVHKGEIWVNNEQLRFLIDVIAEVPSLRVVNTLGVKLLTPREEQVVALVADGLSNREVARELRLSENTVKKYIFRIFEKLGISSRVELVLYALSHGAVRNAEWVAGGAG